MKLRVITNEPEPDEPEPDEPEPEEITHLLLRPAWVPYTAAERAESKGKPARGRQDDAPGPNGEPADSGKWRLLLPDGKVYRGPAISASALETATECEHKWALSRLDNLEKPKNRKAEMGGERHSELEAWLKRGKKPTTEGMSKLIQHFPMPGQCESEVYFGFILGRPGQEIVFAGWIDAREPGVIRDLKTTGDFRWVKTAAQLRANVQACLYGFGEMLRQGTDSVVLKWTYAQIKEPGVITRVETVNEHGSVKDHREVEGVVLTREQALITLRQYLPIAEKMIYAIENEKRAQDMPKNSSSCELYGGCPWKKPEVAACEMPSGGGFMAQMKQERLREKIDTGIEVGVGVGGTGSVAHSATTTATAAVGRKAMSMGSRFGKKTPAAPAPAAAAPAPAPAPAAGGLGARFKKAGAAPSTSATFKAVSTAPTAPAAAAAETKEVLKADVKVTVEGSASKSTGGPAPKSGALMSRLREIVKPGVAAAAVETAIENAPVHAVLASVSTGAVGINPPDAAPEWTQEEQAAEAERIAAKGDKGDKGKVKGEVRKKQLPAVVAVVEAETDETGVLAPAPDAHDNTLETSLRPQTFREYVGQLDVENTETVQKKPRGRPKGSTNSADVFGSTEEVIAELDACAMKCLRSGERRAAAAILRAIDEVTKGN